MSKPLHHQFEDELGDLVDRYLLEGIEVDKLKGVLLYEAGYDHEERWKELTAPVSTPLEPK